MLDHTAAQLALRARAIATVVATTGSTTLSATTTGYTRAAGSFLTDGFRAGMEVTPSGFGANVVDVITDVSALSITTKTAHAAEVGVTGSLTAYLPGLRAYENERFTKDPKRPYLEEEFVPATAGMITMPAATGDLEETGLYVIRLYGLSAYGIVGLRSMIDALRARFSPGTTITAGSASLRVRTDVSTQASQIIAQDNGWSACTLRIPWLARTANAIAA
jgi:hypothetical protein